jgi:hypothetical protein
LKKKGPTNSPDFENQQFFNHRISTTGPVGSQNLK